jgi:uncharacterized membrane protein
VSETPPGEGISRPISAARPADLGPTSTGLDPRVAAALAYLVGWFTGLLFLLLERDNRYIRFHALQSLVGLGGLFAIWAGLVVISVGVMFQSATWFRILMWLSMLVWIASLIVWAICMVKAYLGERWKLPVAGDIAERMLDRWPAPMRR